MYYLNANIRLIDRIFTGLQNFNKDDRIVLQCARMEQY